MYSLGTWQISQNREIYLSFITAIYKIKNTKNDMGDLQYENVLNHITMIIIENLQKKKILVH